MPAATTLVPKRVVPARIFPDCDDTADIVSMAAAVTVVQRRYVPAPPLPVVPKVRMNVPTATLVPVRAVPATVVPVSADTVSNPAALISPVKETPLAKMTHVKKNKKFSPTARWTIGTCSARGTDVNVCCTGVATRTSNTHS